MAQKEESVEKFLSTLRDIPEDISEVEDEEILDIESDNQWHKKAYKFEEINSIKISRGHFLHYWAEELGMPFVKSSTMSIRKR